MSDLPGSPGKGQLEREAAQWCVKMHGPDAESHRSAFEAWLRLGALHRYTYNRIEEVYVLSGRLGAAGSGQGGEEPVPAVGTPPTPAFARAKLGLIAALTLSGAILLVHVAPTAPDRGADSAAGRAPVRLAASASAQRFRLSDGSVVTLQAGSALRVAFDPNRRALALVSGSGLFGVAHEPRPFIVSAAGGTITARGTRFAVTVADAAVDVRLIEGTIDVAYEAAPGAPMVVRHLLAGQGVRYPVARSAVARLRAPPVPSAPQPATVGELVDRANSTAGGSVRIEIADPVLRAVAISGAFRVHDPATTAARLAAMLDLAIGHPRPGIISLAKRLP